MAQNYAYLIQVNALNNNNKFYEITEQDSGEVSVRYGRIGGKVIEKDYGHQKNFWSLKAEKEAKGYEDRTALHSEIKKDDKGLAEARSYAPVKDEAVQELLDLLITSSREFMKQNYSVSVSEITEKMVKEAERDIEFLNEIAMNPKAHHTLYEFNEKLQELFTDVPRNMRKVSDYLAETEADFDKIIQRETEMLDNVKGAIVQAKTPQIENKDQTVLEAYGLSVRPVTYKEEDQITTHLGRDYDGRQVENRYVQGFAVENNQTRKAYEDYKKNNHMSNRDVRLFYHGSKVENFYSIMKTGLSLNPNATVTGKMFGQGLYFAPECRKSLNYMDVQGSCWNGGQRATGFCAVYAVALGKCYEPNRVLGSSFRKEDLPHGANSVFASKHNPHLGLRNDEYIVFDQDACTIKYLLEMTSQNVRTKEYNLDRKMLRDGLTEGFDKLEKTEQGMKAELALEALPRPVMTELSSKITDILDYDKVFVDYNAKNDRISIEGVKNNGQAETLNPDITKDDYAFLMREMKKSFVVCENDWKEVVKASKDYPLGKTVATKDGILPNEIEKNKSKENIVKE